MINEKLYSKAYREVIEILKYVPKAEIDKIPKYILENMYKEMDRNYDYKVTCFEDFENQEMLEETQTILSVIYRNYWATDYQKERIKAKENYDIQLIEEEKSKRYNPEDLFKKTSEKMISTKNTTDELSIVEYKESLFTKIKKILNKLLKRGVKS